MGHSALISNCTNILPCRSNQHNHTDIIHLYADILRSFSLLLSYEEALVQYYNITLRAIFPLIVVFIPYLYGCGLVKKILKHFTLIQIPYRHQLMGSIYALYHLYPNCIASGIIYERNIFLSISFLSSFSGVSFMDSSSLLCFCSTVL